MELNKAIQELSDMCDIVRCGDYYSLENDDIEAIDTVLNELQILKKENDTLWEENIKLKQLNIAYKLRINDFAIDIHKAHAEGYQDGFKQAKFEVEMDKLKEGNNEQV
jgi:hypothetical protein